MLSLLLSRGEFHCVQFLFQCFVFVLQVQYYFCLCLWVIFCLFTFLVFFSFPGGMSMSMSVSWSVGFRVAILAIFRVAICCFMVVLVCCVWLREIKERSHLFCSMASSFPHSPLSPSVSVVQVSSPVVFRVVLSCKSVFSSLPQLRFGARLRRVCSLRRFPTGVGNQALKHEVAYYWHIPCRNINVHVF